jgi:hypothetical protein
VLLLVSTRLTITNTPLSLSDNRRTQTHDALDGNHARRATRTDFHLHFIYTTAQEKIRNHAHAHEMSEPSHPQRTALFADLTILYNNTTFLPRT